MKPLDFLKKCSEVAYDVSCDTKGSLEWEDPTLKATQHIPNQYVDEDTLPSLSHAGDTIEIIINGKDIQYDSLDTLLSGILKPTFDNE